LKIFDFPTQDFLKMRVKKWVVIKQNVIPEGCSRGSSADFAVLNKETTFL